MDHRNTSTIRTLFAHNLPRRPTPYLHAGGGGGAYTGTGGGGGSYIGGRGGDAYNAAGAGEHFTGSGGGGGAIRSPSGDGGDGAIYIRTEATINFTGNYEIVSTPGWDKVYLLKTSGQLTFGGVADRKDQSAFMRRLEKEKDSE